MVKQLIKEEWKPYSLDIFSSNYGELFQPVELFDTKYQIKLKKKKSLLFEIKLKLIW